MVNSTYPPPPLGPVRGMYTPSRPAPPHLWPLRVNGEGIHVTRDHIPQALTTVADSKVTPTVPSGEVITCRPRHAARSSFAASAFTKGGGGGKHALGCGVLQTATATHTGPWPLRRTIRLSGSQPGLCISAAGHSTVSRYIVWPKRQTWICACRGYQCMVVQRVLPCRSNPKIQGFKDSTRVH